MPMLKPEEHPPIIGFCTSVYFERAFLIDMQNELLLKAKFVQGELETFSKTDLFAIRLLKENGYWTED